MELIGRGLDYDDRADDFGFAADMAFSARVKKFELIEYAFAKHVGDWVKENKSGQAIARKYFLATWHLLYTYRSRMVVRLQNEPAKVRDLHIDRESRARWTRKLYLSNSAGKFLLDRRKRKPLDLDLS